MKSESIKIHSSAYIAKEAILTGSVEVERDCCIMHYVTIRGDASYIYIGEQTNIQEHCTLHVSKDYPVILGKKVSVGHGAILHGCKIGRETMVGMGAIIMDGAVIGENCIIAAGALIPPNKVIPDKSLVVGNPGRVKREVMEHEIQHIIENSYIYQEVGRKLRENKI